MVISVKAEADCALFYGKNQVTETNSELPRSGEILSLLLLVVAASRVLQKRKDILKFVVMNF